MLTLTDVRAPSSAEEAQPLYQSAFAAASDGLIIIDAKSRRVLAANPAACALHGYTQADFVDLPAADFIHPDSQSLFNNYAQALQPKEALAALALHRRRDGSAFYVEARWTAFSHQARPCLLGVIRDANKRLQAERLLRQRSEARTHEQTLLLGISQTLVAVPEFRPSLVLEALETIIEYAHAGLWMLEDDGLVALALHGSPQLEQATARRVRLGGPETLTAMFNGAQALRVADVGDAEDPTAEGVRRLLTDELTGLLDGMRAWMWVPLTVKGQAIGAVGLAHAERDHFTVHHADLALIVANQATTAIVNAQLNEQARTLAVLHERQRLARNLHDAVNQSLFSAGLIAEVLPRLWERDQAEGRRSLGDLRRLTRGALAEMRLLLTELQPTALTDSDLGDLLRLLGNALAGRMNIPVLVDVPREVVLPAQAQVALYRLCQEGLNNIAKHAYASRAEIQLKFEAGLVEIRLRDDGRGFDPAAIGSGHFGLTMMRERAQEAGAALSILSQPGHGVELLIRWSEAGAVELHP